LKCKHIILKSCRAFDEITADEEARAVVIWAEGKLFTAGLDLKSSGILSAEGTLSLLQSLNWYNCHSEGSKADQNRKLYKYIRTIQDSFSKIERCPKVCPHHHVFVLMILIPSP
jgi:enoyl-CoA hydratase/carnithine racemase